ncbi:MAG TPA: NAD(P)H-binding protein [Steroidobacteraceae bacterium]|jgi:uncharacterized protein YbjT (DUF2867 family)|nr:NAD(P)H-binding protein [Steroidobacteraceae bacterium]
MNVNANTASAGKPGPAPGSRIALVAGGSGLVGRALLPVLLAAPEYARVQAISRRPLPLEHARLANRVLRFDASLDSQLKGLAVQDAFCCLGTTLRAAGSQAAFRAVDHDLVLAFARAAKAAGAERLVIVSSVGANATSNSFYLRVKGETEQDLEALRLRSLDILQPSLLLGTRSEWRGLEFAGQIAGWILGPLLMGGWSRYRPIEAAVVAAAMRGAARGGRLGVTRYSYPALRRLAGERSGRSASAGINAY